jgi:hypothetical protein
MTFFLGLKILGSVLVGVGSWEVMDVWRWCTVYQKSSVERTYVVASTGANSTFVVKFSEAAVRQLGTKVESYLNVRFDPKNTIG